MAYLTIDEAGAQAEATAAREARTARIMAGISVQAKVEEVQATSRALEKADARAAGSANTANNIAQLRLAGARRDYQYAIDKEALARAAFEKAMGR